MSRIAVAGPPGFGKTTSTIPFKGQGIEIKGLDPKETVMIDVKGDNRYPGYDLNKSIKDGGNYIHTDSATKIEGVIQYIVENRPDVKHVVIDDAGYTMSFDQMRNAKNKNFNVWVDLAVNHMKIVDAVKAADAKRPDVFWIMMYHTEVGEDGLTKIKTSGQMIDRVVALDGLFNTILYAEVQKGENNQPKYVFRTRTDGSSTCRSKLGMFPEEFIPNDMGIVVDYIKKYEQR